MSEHSRYTFGHAESVEYKDGFYIVTNPDPEIVAKHDNLCPAFAMWPCPEGCQDAH